MKLLIKALVLFSAFLFSFPLFAAELKNSSDALELQESLSAQPDFVRSFLVDFDAPLTVKEFKVFLKVNKFTPIELYGHYIVGDSERIFVINDFHTYDADPIETVRYALNRFNSFNDQSVTSASEYVRGNLYDPSLISPLRVEDGWEPVIWSGAKLYGSYSEINRFLGKSGGGSIRFTSKNLAPMIVEAEKKHIRKKVPPIHKKTQKLDRKDSAIKFQIESGSGVQVQSTWTDGPFILGLSCGPGTPSGEANCPNDNAWAPEHVASQAYLEPYNEEDWIGRAWVDFYFVGSQKSRALFSFYRNDLTHCYPVFGPKDARCGGGAQLNAVFVPNAAFEIEYDMYNPTCTLRTGIAFIDRGNGCILAFSLAADIPSPYIDTTISDTQDRFNMTVGSGTPESFVRGNTYNIERILEATDLDVQAHIGGEENFVRAQIGTKYTPTCVLGNEYCVYAVDTRTIASKKWNVY